MKGHHYLFIKLHGIKNKVKKKRVDEFFRINNYAGDRFRIDMFI